MTHLGASLLVVLLACSSTLAFKSGNRGLNGLNHRLKMGFLDDIMTKPSPKVQAPANFQVPEPKPLTLTRPSDVPSVLRSSAGLALRLGTGAFVLGWKIDTLFAPEDGKYALQLGPFRIRDSSSVLSDAPRPKKPLILYEYDAYLSAKEFEK